MRINGRYPVPEILIHVPKVYNLFIDSIITQAYTKEEIQANADYR